MGQDQRNDGSRRVSRDFGGRGRRNNQNNGNNRRSNDQNNNGALLPKLAPPPFTYNGKPDKQI